MATFPLLALASHAEMGLAEGFLTARRPQLKALQPGVQIQPILTTGDTLDSGYQMAGTPDGLGAIDHGNGTFTLLMNHEWTKEDNLSYSRVSKLVIDKANLKVLKGEYLINGSEGYNSFCSATMVGRKEGFSSPLFFTNEESTDGKYKGTVVAVNPKTGDYRNLPWLGHFDHENTIALPKYNKIVLMLTDDNAPGGIYMYIANNETDLLTGKGQLYVFKADVGSTPADIQKGSSVSGRFIPISPFEARNVNRIRAAIAAKGAMSFVRPEDITHDVKQPNIVYFASTGRSEYINPDTGKPYDAKGRIHKMTLNPTDPTKVEALQILLAGDVGDPIINPDNLATSDRSIMIQEDQNGEFRGKRPARIWHYDLRNKALTPVAAVVQKDFDGKPIPGDIAGNWESSGIINTANILGPNTWLLDVQAHTQVVNQLGGKDEGGQLLLLTVPDSGARLPETP
ncbi:MAG: alkaline phosphatase PhoX [Thermosynechococcaceae cyanobacterium]